MTIQQFPHNEPLYLQVFQLIEARIVSGELHVGDRLPTEAKLAQMHKVSRGVIREAIKALKEKGWVETRVAKGTFVVNNVVKSVESSFDVTVRMRPGEKFANLAQVRLILEPELAALAATAADPDDISRMRQAVDRMEKSLEGGSNIDDFLEGDFAFHMAIAESTGNVLIPLISAPIVNLMHDMQRYQLEHVERGKHRSQYNHRRVMDAIEKHDPETARRSMYEHIIQVRDDIQGSG